MFIVGTLFLFNKAERYLTGDLTCSIWRLMCQAAQYGVVLQEIAMNHDNPGFFSATIVTLVSSGFSMVALWHSGV